MEKKSENFEPDAKYKYKYVQSCIRFNSNHKLRENSIKFI